MMPGVNQVISLATLAALVACAPDTRSPGLASTPAAERSAAAAVSPGPAVSPAGSTSPAGPASPSAPPPASPIVGGWFAVASDDARIRTAVDQGVAQLRGAAWLAAPGLAAGSVRTAERQIVAGTNHRATIELQNGQQRRTARLRVLEDLQGAYHLEEVDLGPVGVDAPLPDVPATAAGLPGGWAEQARDDQALAKTAEVVRTLLAGADWLGRAVVLVQVLEGKTQVVAGLNTYLALEVQLDGQSRRVDTIVYEPLQGAASLSWVRVTAPFRPAP